MRDSRGASRNSRICSRENSGPRSAPCMASRPARRPCAACPRALCQTASGAPRAPPASPAAGWIQMSSKIPSRSSTPLATQLSATPPARQRLRLPVSSRAWRASFSDDLLGDLLDRLREVHLALRDRRLGRARRAAEQRGEPVVGHHQAVEVAEVVHVEAERAVLAQVDQLALDEVGVAPARRRARGPSACTRRS